MKFPRARSTDSVVGLISRHYRACLLIVAVMVCRDCKAASYALGYDAAGNQMVQQSVSLGPPIIAQQIPDQIVQPSTSASFSVNVSSPLPVTYQWKFNGAAISGAVGDSLLLANIRTSDQGGYSVIVTNSAGSVTSNTAKLYVSINPATFLYWTASSGDFNNPANWSGNRVPGPGDTVVIDSGTFTLPTTGTITASQVTVTVPYAAPATSDVALNITGNWTFSGSFTLTTGHQFAVTGGSVTVSGPTILNGASLLAGGGAKVTFSAIAAYSLPSGASVQWVASDSSSQLNFSNLKTITGNATPGCYFDIIAQNGGRTSLPALITITKPDDGDSLYNSGIRLYATNGGTLSAPALSSFQDNDTHPGSLLQASGGGTMILTSLSQAGIRGVTLNGVTLTAPAQPIPVVSSVTRTGGNVILTVPTLTGHTYQLQQTGSLSSGAWQNVGTAQSGTGSPMNLTAPAQGTAQFYRVIISPWP